MIYPRIIDSWRGSSSPSHQFHYRLTELSPTSYIVEMSIDGESFTPIHNNSSSNNAHTIARKIGDILRLENQALNRLYQRKIS